MKKFAITTFAVLYVVLIFAGSAERSNVWATREAESITQHCAGQPFHGFGKTEKSETHLWQTKLIETGFVVEMPREASAVPIHSERYILLSLVDYPDTQSGPRLSSRAPPFLA